jgi:hypothetical protein
MRQHNFGSALRLTLYGLAGAVFLAGAGLFRATAGEGQKIIFSSTDTAVSTNSTSSSRNPDTRTGLLNSMQDGVLRPLGKSLDPTEAYQEEMDGELQLRRLGHDKDKPLTKREKEAADKRKNWVFTTMKDLESDARGQSTETTNIDDLANPDASDKPASVIERFINGGGDSSVSNRPQTVEWSRSAAIDRSDSQGLGSAMSRGGGLDDSFKQNLLGSDFGSDRPGTVSGGYVGLNQAGAENSVSIRHLNDFKKLIDPDAAPAQPFSGTPGSGLFGGAVGTGPSVIGSRFGSSGQSFSTFSHYSLGAPSGGYTPAGNALNPGGSSLGTGLNPAYGRTVSPQQPNVQQMLNPFESVSKRPGY